MIFFSIENIPLLTRMTQYWIKNITIENEDDWKFQINIQKMLSMVMYMSKKYIINFKIIYAM